MRIAVVDTGSGNLRSVEKAIAHVGGDVVVTTDAETVRRADKIVVPGQGAFADCMAGLRRGGLDEAVREAVAGGKPFLGICLGLQVLFEESDEHGRHQGLGLLGGRVERFVARPGLKVPHMGWNAIRLERRDPMFAGVPDGAHYYFVHSYYVRPADPSVVAASCTYDLEFCAAIRKDNLFATQFHPEKSQALGLTLLANFVEAA